MHNDSSSVRNLSPLHRKQMIIYGTQVFSKVPKSFARISGDMILFTSSKRKRDEARNFAVFVIFIPFTTHEKTSFTEYASRSFTNHFSGPKSFRHFRETGPSFVIYTLTVAIWT